MGGSASLAANAIPGIANARLETIPRIRVTGFPVRPRALLERVPIARIERTGGEEVAILVHRHELVVGVTAVVEVLVIVLAEFRIILVPVFVPIAGRRNRHGEAARAGVLAAELVDLRGAIGFGIGVVACPTQFLPICRTFLDTERAVP